MAMLKKKMLATTLYLVSHVFQISYTFTNDSRFNTSRVAHYEALLERLFQRPSIKYKAPPKFSSMDNTCEVFISFTPFDIRYVDEVQQIVGLATLTTLVWTFEDLKWDPEDYMEIEEVNIDRNRIWTPAITNPKAKVKPFLEIPETVVLTAWQVVAEIPVMFETICDFDISHFPFDSHNCTIPFIEMEFYNLTPMYWYKGEHLLREYFTANTEWTLLNSSCDIYEAEGQGFHYTTCWFTMKRESIFYVTNIIIPLFLMAAMTLCVFLIPAESGEKISFMVSLFVSMAVFINFVIDTIPRSMTQIPSLVILILVLMIKLVMCVIASSFVIRRYYEQLKEENVDSEFTEERHLTSSNISSQLNVRDVESFDKIYKNDSETVGFISRSQSHSDLRTHMPLKTNKVGIMPNTIESKSTYHTTGESLLNKGCTSKFKGKMTHRQLDKCFFFIFLIGSIFVYAIIFSYRSW